MDRAVAFVAKCKRRTSTMDLELRSTICDYLLIINLFIFSFSIVAVSSTTVSDVVRRLSGDDDYVDPYASLKGNLFGVRVVSGLAIGRAHNQPATQHSNLTSEVGRVTKTPNDEHFFTLPFVSSFGLYAAG
jgi:hypothetical protein